MVLYELVQFLHKLLSTPLPESAASVAMILFILGLIVVDYVYTATRKRDGKVLHKGVFSDYINDGRVSPTCIIKKAVIQSIAGAQKLEPEDISVELIRQTPR